MTECVNAYCMQRAMQPLKNNIFLSHKVHKAPILERIGGFFLAPVDFIAAGKTVYIKKEGGRRKVDHIDQTYSYKKCHMIRLILAILALPIAIILGSLFKGLSYAFSSTTRANHRLIRDHINDSNRQVDNTQLYKNLGILQEEQTPADLYGNEIAHCEDMPRGPRKNKELQDVQIEAMHDVLALLHAEDIPCWADFGTSLGAHRYGDIIPWDHDVDVSVLEPDFDNVLHLLRRLDPKKYIVRDYSSYNHPKTYIRLYIKGANTSLDIYTYHINQAKREVNFNYSYRDAWIPKKWKTLESSQTGASSYETLFPLKKAKFGDREIYVPNQLEDWLKVKYGPDLRPPNQWNEKTNSYERVADHPYWKVSHY